MKIIDLDWKNCDTIKETLKVYLQEKITAAKELRKELAVNLAHKKPVEVYLTKEELKQAKDHQKTLNRAFKKATSDIPKLEKLLKILNKNIGGT